MTDWERSLEGALSDTPEWPGDTAALWRRIARRLPLPWHRRLPLPWHRRRWPLAAAGLAAAVAALALTALLRPAPPPAPGPGQLAVAAHVLGRPQAGQPLRFGVVVGPGSGQPYRVNDGRVEVRAAAGDLVWESPVPELAGRSLQGSDALSAELDWPEAGAPGHYRLGVSLLAAAPSGQPAAVVSRQVVFFVPYPDGTMRVGDVPVGQALTRGPVTATLEQVRLLDDTTRLHFSLLGEGLSGQFQWHLRDVTGSPYPHVQTEYYQDGPRLVGVAQFEPTPVTVPVLLVRLERVGALDGGSRAVDLPYTWEWQVGLD